MGKDSVEEKERKGFRGRSQKTIEAVDWTAIDASLVVRTIATVSAAGGALRFGYSRDGGAYALGIYGDGEPYTEFFHEAQEMETVLNDLAEWFTDQPRSELNTSKASRRSKTA